jgi:hypothetical protein
LLPLYPPASLLAVVSSWSVAPGQQAGLFESGSKLPHSKALQLTVLAYLLPFVKRHRVRFGPARGESGLPQGSFAPRSGRGRVCTIRREA